MGPLSRRTEAHFVNYNRLCWKWKSSLPSLSLTYLQVSDKNNICCSYNPTILKHLHKGKKKNTCDVTERAVDFGDRTLSQLFVPPSQINLCPCFSPVSNSTNLDASSLWLEDLNVGINIPSCDNLLCFSHS